MGLFFFSFPVTFILLRMADCRLGLRVTALLLSVTADDIFRTLFRTSFILMEGATTVLTERLPGMSDFIFLMPGWRGGGLELEVAGATGGFFPVVSDFSDDNDNFLPEDFEG